MHSALTSTQQCFCPTMHRVFLRTVEAKQGTKPSAASCGHHGNLALASHLVLNEDLAPNFFFLV